MTWNYFLSHCRILDPLQNKVQPRSRQLCDLANTKLTREELKRMDELARKLEKMDAWLSSTLVFEAP
jgi:hypothetical protein